MNDITRKINVRKRSLTILIYAQVRKSSESYVNALFHQHSSFPTYPKGFSRFLVHDQRHFSADYSLSLESHNSSHKCSCPGFPPVLVETALGFQFFSLWAEGKKVVLIQMCFLIFLVICTSLCFCLLSRCTPKSMSPTSSRRTPPKRAMYK